MQTKYFRTTNNYDFGWFWTPFTYRFGHGGWMFFNPLKPIATFKWIIRFIKGV